MQRGRPELANCQHTHMDGPQGRGFRMFNKVFCIGFNKTGTSSMDRLFTELGLKSFHGYYSHIPVTDPLYRDYQCFSDGDQHDFALLDRTFPGSRFIVTTRPLDDWLVSRIRHVEQRRRLGATGPMRAGVREPTRRWRSAAGWNAGWTTTGRWRRTSPGGPGRCWSSTSARPGSRAGLRGDHRLPRARAPGGAHAAPRERPAPRRARRRACAARRRCARRSAPRCRELGLPPAQHAAVFP